MRNPFTINKPKNEQKEGEQKNETPLQTITELGQMTLPEFKSDIHVISIIGQIEGHMVMAPRIKQQNTSISSPSSSARNSPTTSKACSFF